MPRGPCRLLRSIFRLAYWKPTCSRLATLRDRRACLSNSHCLKVLLRSRKGCAMPPTLFLWRPNRDLFPRSGTFRSSPFSSGSSRGSGGSLRSVSDTTTACGSYSGPNRSRPGWMISSQKSKRLADPQPGFGRSYAPNTMSGSASAGTATSRTSTEYSAFHWDPRASSGSANPLASHGTVSRSMPNLARST
jgi:hypothetical protein